MAPIPIFSTKRRIFYTMSKRMIALLMCAAMLITCFAGCSVKKLDEDPDPGAFITMYLTDDIFDFDPANAYNNTDTSGLSYEGIYAVALFNQYLFRYDEFKTLALEKYLEFQPRIVNLYEDNELGRCKIDVFYETYGEAAARNNELWSVATAFSTYEHTPVDGTYEGEILFLKNWLKNRNEYILNYYGLAE